MIAVTCRNGRHFSVDPAAIERVETDPDTVIHLVDGTKYVVSGTFDELLKTIQVHRAVAAAAHLRLTDPLPSEPAPLRVERRQFSRDGAATGGSTGAVPPGTDEA